MATVNTVVDDFDHSVPAETITFHVHGKGYNIDLGEKNAEELQSVLDEFEAAMKKYTDVARPLGRVSAPAPAKATKSESRAKSAYDAKAIRAWAKEEGIEVSERGRIPHELVERYNARGR